MVNDVDLDLGILMGLAYNAFVEKLNAHLRASGFDDLGRYYGYVFRALAADEPSLRELADRLGMTSAAMK